MEILTECFFPIALKNIGTWPIFFWGLATYSIFGTFGEQDSCRQESKNISLIKLQYDLWVWPVTMIQKSQQSGHRVSCERL